MENSRSGTCLVCAVCAPGALWVTHTLTCVSWTCALPRLPCLLSTQGVIILAS